MNKSIFTNRKSLQRENQQVSCILSFRNTLSRTIKQLFFIVAFSYLTTSLFAQADTSVSTYLKPKLRNYEVKQAFEIESLVPMFFTGGYHYAACYRYHRFRVRASVINGGAYDAESAGIRNSSSDYKRYYKTSPGFFVGYNIWKNLEMYTYLELHTFEIEQKTSGLKKDIHSTDFGGGISYQFFIGRHLYLQPGLHIYLRGNNSVDFNGSRYNIPNADLAPVLRIGFRYWSKY